MRTLFAKLFILLLITGAQSHLSAKEPVKQQNPLDVLPAQWHGKPKHQMLRTILREQAHVAFEKRAEKIAKIKTPAQIKQYQKEMRAFFIKQLGGFPKRTPLNAQVVGKIPGDGYRLEKIIYESRPGFYVTALLYLPTSKAPYPGVLLPCGHSENGKAAEPYQRASMLLAKNGCAVLCFDPIGQGERKQLLNKQGKGIHRSTSEHMLAGVPPILLGENLVTYMMWDGMRGIDYLCSRKDIDKTKIGCTGISGGGNLTSMLMAIDDRIQCAAPGCFTTTMKIKNERPGPGDAEQNIHAQISGGLDHADYIMMRAPKPTLLLAATQDFIPIEGTWEAFREAKRCYTRLGFAERVDLIEADDKHGFGPDLRVASTRWMRRWLLKKDDVITETLTPILSDRDLQCTPHGQVLLIKDARSVFDLYREKEKELATKRKQLWQEKGRKEMLKRVREVTGIKSYENIVISKKFFSKVKKENGIKRKDYAITKENILTSEEMPLPVLFYGSTKAISGELYIYIHGQGKNEVDIEKKELEKLISKGHYVLSIDLSGMGETAVKPWRYGKTTPFMGVNAAECFIAQMLGKSMMARRAEEIILIQKEFEHFFLSAFNSHLRSYHLIAAGEAIIPTLHAAALTDDAKIFKTVTLRNSINSWHDVIQKPEMKNQFINTVHGALRVYDLPDLRKSLKHTKLIIETTKKKAS